MGRLEGPRLKLASFHAAGRDRVGILSEGMLIDALAALATWADTRLFEGGRPRSLLELIEAGEPVLPLLAETLERVVAGEPVERFSPEEVLWHPPVRRPSKICCLALNNSANADRILQGPKHPAMFIKPSSSLIGHGGAIECRPEYGRTHPEPELAVVIGKKARNVRAAQAYDYVFGYTIHNDITSPTMRGEDTFHYRAIHPKEGDPKQIEYVSTWVSYPGRYKCCDTFACMGPWVVTRDEIPEPHDLQVSCAHGDRLITQDNTCNLFFKIPQVLEFLSRYLTLLPGDIVSMGTALKSGAGGGAVQNVDLNRFGGTVSVSIERIGTLTNTVAWV